MTEKFTELHRWIPDLSNQVVETLEKIDQELAKFNKTINLVSPNSTLNSHELHFFDSIAPLKFLFSNGFLKSNDEFYDIGSGNGFPGLLAAVLEPGIRVYLVEIDQRKCEYLKFLGSRLKLDNLSILNRDVNMLDMKLNRVICRGFKSISETAEILNSQIERGGWVFHLKGADWITETKDLNSSTWNINALWSYRLPISGKERCLVGSQRTF